MKRHIRLLLAVMISFICCLGTYAQEQRATITGVVKGLSYYSWGFNNLP